MVCKVVSLQSTMRSERARRMVLSDSPVVNAMARILTPLRSMIALTLLVIIIDLTTMSFVDPDAAMEYEPVHQGSRSPFTCEKIPQPVRA